MDDYVSSIARFHQSFAKSGKESAPPYPAEVSDGSSGGVEKSSIVGRPKKEIVRSKSLDDSISCITCCFSRSLAMPGMESVPPIPAAEVSDGRGGSEGNVAPLLAE
jgi:hypothetical protein